MGNRFFNSRKLCLNFKIDLNFFLQIFNPLITLLIAAIKKRNLSQMRINQFLMSFRKKSIIIFIIFFELNFFLNVILLERSVLLISSKKLKKILDKK